MHCVCITYTNCVLDVQFVYVIFFENVTFKWANNCCEDFVLKVVNDGLLR